MTFPTDPKTSTPPHGDPLRVPPKPKPKLTLTVEVDVDPGRRDPLRRDPLQRNPNLNR